MENTNVPVGFMLKAAQLKSPQGNKWVLLGTKNWANDFGLKKLFVQLYGERQWNYYFQEKSRKSLWDLMTYIDSKKAIEIAKYYEFPDPKTFVEFLKWVYNWVAPPRAWSTPKGLDQMDCFPYAWLHAQWTETVKPTLKATSECKNCGADIPEGTNYCDNLCEAEHGEHKEATEQGVIS